MANNDKGYYEENYAGYETSNEVIDAIEEISGEIGVDFDDIWNDGYTQDFSSDEILEKVVNIILKNEGEDVRGEFFYWGNSLFEIPHMIDVLNVYDGGETVAIGTDEQAIEWLKNVIDEWDDEILVSELENYRKVSLIDVINGNGDSYKYIDGDISERIEWIEGVLDYEQRTTIFVINEYLEKHCPEYEN
jgi:hypothetical protein